MVSGMAGAAGAADDVTEIANDLRAIILRLARHLRSQAHASGLTGAQIAILVALEFNPGMTAQQLAAREGLSGAGVSGHLARLEGKGLIRRERGADPRSISLFLTDPGLTLVSLVRRQRTSWLIGRLGELPAEDLERLKESLAVLDRVSLGDR